MSLIIKDKIPMFKRGYPTVSDKYNVSGAVLSGAYPVRFGDIVKDAATLGYFAGVNANNTIANVAEIRGFVVATNVKLNETYGGELVETKPGEAFNLLVDGFIAVELAEGAVEAEIKPNAAAYVTANGEVTTTGDNAKLGANPIPNTVFTGMYEKHGDKIFAEIYIK